jgi:hypothetical protein
MPVWQPGASTEAAAGSSGARQNQQHTSCAAASCALRLSTSDSYWNRPPCKQQIALAAAKPTIFPREARRVSGDSKNSVGVRRAQAGWPPTSAAAVRRM